MTFEECTPGRGVIYRPYPQARNEQGEIVRQSPGGVFVFVRFRGDSGAKACHPSHLEAAHTKGPR